MTINQSNVMLSYFWASSKVNGRFDYPRTSKVSTFPDDLIAVIDDFCFGMKPRRKIGEKVVKVLLSIKEIKRTNTLASNVAGQYSLVSHVLYVSDKLPRARMFWTMIHEILHHVTHVDKTVNLSHSEIHLLSRHIMLYLTQQYVVSIRRWPNGNSNKKIVQPETYRLEITRISGSVVGRHG